MQLPIENWRDVPFVITVEPTSEESCPGRHSRDAEHEFPARATVGDADGGRPVKRLLTAAVARWRRLRLGRSPARPIRAIAPKRAARQVAAGLDSPDRDARQRPAELVKALDIRPGSTVVDLGTGAGYMLPYLSRAVGADGVGDRRRYPARTFSTARGPKPGRHLENVRFVLGTGPGSAACPPASADLILVLDAYHHFDYPDRMLARSGERAASRRTPGDCRVLQAPWGHGAGDPDRPLTHIRLDADDVIREVEANGFRLLKRQDQIPGSQYIAIFGKK